MKRMIAFWILVCLVLAGCAQSNTEKPIVPKDPHAIEKEKLSLFLGNTITFSNITEIGKSSALDYSIFVKNFDSINTTYFSTGRPAVFCSGKRSTAQDSTYSSGYSSMFLIWDVDKNYYRLVEGSFMSSTLSNILYSEFSSISSITASRRYSESSYSYVDAEYVTTTKNTDYTSDMVVAKE